MAELAALKERRRQLKSSSTRTNTYVDGVRELTPEVLSQLTERKDKLDTFWNQFQVTQDAIDKFEPDDDDRERIQFEDSFYSINSKIRTLLSRANNLSHNNRNDARTPNPTSNASNSTLVKLPKINMPTFSGKYDEWVPFNNVFQSIIHENTELGKVQKFQYLLSLLTGEASDLIRSLELSEANYDVALKLIKDRYDNNRVIVSNHIKEIFELPQMQRENFQQLKTIIDGTTKHLRALNSLGRETDSWDDLIIFILTSKIDNVTNKEWQTSLSGSSLPTLKELLDFLTQRYQALEVTTNKRVLTDSNYSNPSKSNKQTLSHVVTTENKCIFCNGAHIIYHCKEFLNLSKPQRLVEIRKKRICTNCLRSKMHGATKCTSGSCRSCGNKHNTLLHFDTNHQSNDHSTVNTPSTDNQSDNSKSLVAAHSSAVQCSQSLLSTAIIDVFDSNGSKIPARVLLDPGSQASFMTSRLFDKLNLISYTTNVSISGINQIQSSANKISRIKFQSRFTSYAATIECIITNIITDQIPNFALDKRDVRIPKGLALADPNFYTPSEVDMIIGVDQFWQLICIGQIKANQHHPVLQKTVLGWILAGPVSTINNKNLRVNNFFISSKVDSLHENLQQFWSMESVLDEKNVNFTRDELSCIDHFHKTVDRAKDGRFIVQIPFNKDSLSQLGESRSIAEKRFKKLEIRLDKDGDLKIEYSRFMKEYETLSHMRKLSITELDDNATPPPFYLPHHCVIKQDSATTKLRVVFDGSSKTSTGISVNDAQLIGPVVQQDLFSILTRFRTRKFVFTADITKMYRQVRVHPEHTRFQRILWRYDSQEPLSTYELLTVTYGTASASFLSTQCLQHLADIGLRSYPLGSKAIQHDFYVDDLLTGQDTIEAAIETRDQIYQLLKEGGFVLDKWAANETALLNSPYVTSSAHVIDFASESESKILGIYWKPSEDYLSFHISSNIPGNTITKRVILAETARIFDPLGLVAPVIITPKLLIQELWQLGKDWDSSIPQDIHTRWFKFRSQLPSLNSLKIPRHVNSNAWGTDVEIHGFCDASQVAYGACIYVRSKCGPNDFVVHLLCAKSRIAPLKVVSIPRLELCGSLLLSQLYEKLKGVIDMSKIPICFWSDSTIALSWIKTSSKRLSTFVGNRVSEIQKITESIPWKHISSQDNPADVLSRGIDPCLIADCRLWWHGPEWLSKSAEDWPDNTTPDMVVEVPELRKIVVHVNNVNNCFINSLLERHSNINKIVRVIAYCLLFVSRLRKESVQNNELSPTDLHNAMHAICKSIQHSEFEDELRDLKTHSKIKNNSKLTMLSPFLDNDGLIRVGGRLERASLPFNTRHPILLPKKHRLTDLIIESEHIRNMHCGIKSTIYAVRQNFWPLGIGNSTKRIVRGCVRCYKCNPKDSIIKMSDLPVNRIQESIPFFNVGVDYAGPILVKDHKRRNPKKTKAYIAIFVCFATKACHIELVSDLTSESFLASFNRFIARRGRPVNVYSDNGTNFVGASHEIEELYNFLKGEKVQNEISCHLLKSRIKWHFIPPNAPHYGGLWESAVKSTKLLLHRVSANACLTFEELYTLLCGIESILNSRPLTPISEDPNDLQCLTPGHFLIGQPLNAIPQPNLLEIKQNRLSRWQYLEQIRQHFWKRWSLEYLNNLQARNKWRFDKGPVLSLGQIVLLKEQNTAPLQWSLGRIVELHPSIDDRARSATVRTAKGLLVRPITKICILPIET